MSKFVKFISSIQQNPTKSGALCKTDQHKSENHNHHYVWQPRKLKKIKERINTTSEDKRAREAEDERVPDAAAAEAGLDAQGGPRSEGSEEKGEPSNRGVAGDNGRGRAQGKRVSGYFFVFFN